MIGTHILCEKQGKINEAYKNLDEDWLRNGEKVSPAEFANLNCADGDQVRKPAEFGDCAYVVRNDRRGEFVSLFNCHINGKQFGVVPSQDSDTLFIGNIVKLKAKLIHHGVDNFEDLTLVEDTKNEGMNRGPEKIAFEDTFIEMDTACVPAITIIGRGANTTAICLPMYDIIGKWMEELTLKNAPYLTTYVPLVSGSNLLRFVMESGNKGCEVVSLTA
ncbi:hypothetical protein C5167_041053, partial [Papaver somniferum]